MTGRTDISGHGTFPSSKSLNELRNNHMMELSGKVALVTGAQQGIGRAIAIAFAQAGADVGINFLDDLEAAKEVAAKVSATGRKAILIQGDVSQVSDTARMVERTVGELGRIDILVNNAGIFPRVPFLDMQETDWDRVLDVNLKGAAFCAQATARAMIAAGTRGTVINIASRAMMGTSPKGAHYASSKGGVASLTRALALELAPFGIRVNAIAPGLVDTAQPRFGSTEQELQERGQKMPIGRMGQPEDIASVAVFLASDRSSFILGQTLHANGGSYLA